MAGSGITLASIGEDRLLERLLQRVPGSDDLLIGPGDDCAAVQAGNGQLLLLKTDCVVEGVHYARDTDPQAVGRKALCRPLSDIAAMGGTSDHALITIFSPSESLVSYWEGVYRGIVHAARRFGVTIAGGETTSSPARAISVALTGHVSARHVARRSTGQPGDTLVVTGRLGGSISGHHLTFIPRLEEGRWLAARPGLHAMMDLSDGLASDLPRLARASGTGFVIDESTLPLNRGCSTAAALGDGEDYELLCAIAPDALPRLLQDWRKAFPRQRLTPIGSLTRAGASPAPGTGFDHFRIARAAPTG